MVEIKRVYEPSVEAMMKKYPLFNGKSGALWSDPSDNSVHVFWTTPVDMFRARDKAEAEMVDRIYVHKLPDWPHL